MPSPSLTLEQILMMLPAAPSRIAAITTGLTDAQLDSAPKLGEWSVNEIVAHLRACADVWGDCIAAILVQDKPTLKAVNPRTWITQTDYLEQAFRPALHAFTVQRTELLTVLKSLAPEDWSRSATVTGAGKPLERTVHTYAESLALHERPHLKQIERTVNAVRS